MGNTTKPQIKYLLRLLRVIIALIILTTTETAAANQLSGKIVGVSDGDAVTLLDQNNRQHKIRLMGIDAPENSQAFGQESKQSLSELVFNKQVVADCPSTDRYAENLCKIFVGGIDANLAQIERGYAWYYKQYQSDQSPDDRVKYSAAEGTARQTRLAIWSDSNPIPPWEYRRGGNASAQLPNYGNPTATEPSAIAQGVVSGSVKMSRSGICHAPGTTYYSKTRHYTPYDTLDACLQAGGRLPKR
ncbi:thermonuclease family protein [Haematospirillum jordaniae]|uniref:thermonuclease family protein n=1 Tax=Haematospirillum jordaniae TaxID=1549855 RepID=UPI0009EF608E|nr:thermonuclease family protein [Haematospirillum jordaniae]NKD58170.1 thermonuclease family protein [Haematospirillum jordaniae]NKD60278.1 thermonuclease family protein [Haematospirillum jordaniae]NKD68219.1 thermonuclease family protein [Haematospirillum jordaniae]NKD80236.1 thermonuclease family protein [Haematospirillum jordaniae]NKD82433.1 thermonuclease family protein [Haematospirillum jordaniae]